VLGGFLKREALFHHMEFQQRFDAPAKVNLTWELCELAAELPGQFQPTIP
jgi:predicted metal-dependent HD superfamily phosphohydrolase